MSTTSDNQSSVSVAAKEAVESKDEKVMVKRPSLEVKGLDKLPAQYQYFIQEVRLAAGELQAMGALVTPKEVSDALAARSFSPIVKTIHAKGTLEGACRAFVEEPGMERVGPVYVAFIEVTAPDPMSFVVTAFLVKKKDHVVPWLTIFNKDGLSACMNLPCGHPLCRLSAMWFMNSLPNSKAVAKFVSSFGMRATPSPAQQAEMCCCIECHIPSFRLFEGDSSFALPVVSALTNAGAWELCNLTNDNGIQVEGQSVPVTSSVSASVADNVGM